MRYLVLSDLHGNRDALDAVLQDSAGSYDRVVCCGDIVGYGPDPNSVADWVRTHSHVTIRGNHDRACCGMEDLEWFNDVAQQASRWTMRHLSQENYDWLRSLPRGPVVEAGFQLAHGSPLDEDEYVTNLNDADYVFSYVEANLTFFGHTHLQGGFAWLDGKRGEIRRPAPDEKAVSLRVHADGAYLVNPGSVGQPRDGDPRAAYAIYDDELREVQLARVSYDFGTVRNKVALAGLPDALGERLARGR